jgi:hypothetical protein
MKALTDVEQGGRQGSPEVRDRLGLRAYGLIEPVLGLLGDHRPFIGEGISLALVEDRPLALVQRGRPDAVHLKGGVGKQDFRLTAAGAVPVTLPVLDQPGPFAIRERHRGSSQEVLKESAIRNRQLAPELFLPRGREPCKETLENLGGRAGDALANVLDPGVTPALIVSQQPAHLVGTRSRHRSESVAVVAKDGDPGPDLRQLRGVVPIPIGIDHVESTVPRKVAPRPRGLGLRRPQEPNHRSQPLGAHGLEGLETQERPRIGDRENVLT